VNNYDLAISLIPYTYHAAVIAIEDKTNVVITMHVLRPSLKAAGIIVMLNEIGTFGIDYLYSHLRFPSNTIYKTGTGP
jgi:hypothetical protein